MITSQYIPLVLYILKNKRDFHMEQLGHLKFERTIGRGTFGKVRRAIHEPTGRPVAVKVLNKQKIATKKDALRIEREIRILKRINHPNLLKLLQLIETDKSFLLVTKLVEGEQLYQRINRKGALHEEEARQCFVQLLDAVIHLRNRGIAHRDIKPENIIMEGSKLTLIDYGLGNTYTEGQKLSTSCGSHCYAAPEMMNGISYDPEKTEVWALGVTLYAMLSGKLPFEDDNPGKLMKAMLNNRYQEIPNISPAVKDLLKGMIEAKVGNRLTLNEIRGHKWVKAMEHQFVEQSDESCDERLLSLMSSELQVNRTHLLRRIREGFGEETISYYLRQGEAKEEDLQVHSGPVHLKFVFKSLELAQGFIKEQEPGCQRSSTGEGRGLWRRWRIKKVRGSLFYVCVSESD